MVKSYKGTAMKSKISRKSNKKGKNYLNNANFLTNKEITRRIRGNKFLKESALSESLDHYTVPNNSKKMNGLQKKIQT